MDACRIRLRPIIMTSLAFILGVVPLLVSRGAGAEMRMALGVAVFQRHAGRNAVRIVVHACVLQHYHGIPRTTRGEAGGECRDIAAARAGDDRLIQPARHGNGLGLLPASRSICSTFPRRGDSAWTSRPPPRRG